jgi:predicted NAD/FAD-binding protein
LIAPRRIAVIGGGIGGLTAALSREPIVAVWGGKSPCFAPV